MRATRHFAPLAFVCIVAACGDRDSSASAKPGLSTDSTLEADLRRARVDTSAYGEAADVAVGEVPDSMLARPSGPPPMVEPGNMGPRSAPDAGARTSPATRPPAVRVDNSPSPGAEAGCDSPALPDQRRCLMAYLARSDAGLDRAYQAVIAEMKRQSPAPTDGREPEVVRKLRAQERAWLVYRDTECRRTNRDTEGPLWAGVRAQCLGEFSAHREAQLRTALENMQRR